MTDERYVTLDALLPVDPEPGEVYVMPEGQVGGASTMTFIYAGGVCIGYTSQYARVANVSSHSFLGRTITSKPLARGMHIRLLGEQFNFKSLIFVEYFGWTVYEYSPNPTVLLDATFEVLHATSLRKEKSDLYLFDQVCLKKHQKEETDARTANQDRPPNDEAAAGHTPTSPAAATADGAETGTN